jgi:hypothetical protein
LKNLFSPRSWYELIPHQTHSVVTHGYDSFSGLVGRLLASLGWSGRASWLIEKLSGAGSISTNTYVTAARSSDGSLLIAYMPSLHAIAVNTSKLAGPAIARWYDPTNGMYIDASDSPLANSGQKEFAPPGQNAAGDGDWVLVLEAPTNH